MTEAETERRTKFRAANWRAHNAALTTRCSLTMWLDLDLQGLATLNGRRSHSPTFSDAAILFCLTIQCLFGRPLRQELSIVCSLRQLARPGWPASDFNTVCRRQKRLQIDLNRRSSKSQFPVASTGTKFLSEGGSKREKQGAGCWCEWRKCQVPDDCLLFCRRPLLISRDVIRAVLAEFKGRG